MKQLAQIAAAVRNAGANAFWAAICVLAVLCGLMGWLYIEQRNAHARAELILTSQQYATGDLMDGMAQLLLDDGTNPLFDSKRALILLKQGMAEMRSTGELLHDNEDVDDDTHAIVTDLERDLKLFEQALSLPRTPGSTASVDAVALRIVVYRILQQQSRIASHVRARLRMELEALQGDFYIGVATTIAVLLAVLLLLRIHSRADDRALKNAGAAEAALRDSDKRLRALLESATENVWVSTPRGESFEVTPAWTFADGRSCSQWSYKDWLAEVHPDDRHHLSHAFRSALRTKGVFRAEYRMAGIGGSWRWLHARGIPILGPDGHIHEWLGMTFDITERKSIEDQLRQSHKMEAIGQLTGGVAHDFNNLLAIILGNLELLEERLDDRSLKEHVEQAITACERGSALAHQLLAFARRQTLLPQRIDLPDHFKILLKLLHRAVGEGITVTLDNTAPNLPVMVDPAQFDTAILNLAINARDAMEGSGRLTIALEKVATADIRTAADDAMSLHAHYAVISVSDTGSGMSSETIARAFDPFFTTKPIGKGSGLGLSMVHGFVRQSQGSVSIDSQPGHGTTVRIYIPLAPAVDSEAESLVPTHTASPQNSLRLLLVEDNPAVLNTVRLQLNDLGHRVQTAGSASEALAILSDGTDFDLLLTDVLMPGEMNGLGLIERISAQSHHPPVIAMSGSEISSEIAQKLAQEGHQFLEKPFRKSDLATAITKAMSRSKSR